MRGLWLLSGGVLVLAGCDPIISPLATAAVVSGGAAALTLPQTKKLPADHMMSAATGRDCSIIHYEKDGVYCPPYPREIDRSNLRCVKTLGGIECHQLPDPYLGRVQSLASPPPPPVDQP